MSEEEIKVESETKQETEQAESGKEDVASDTVDAPIVEGVTAANAGTPEEQLRLLNDRYIRLLAEFDNFRKRKVKEQTDQARYEGERFFADLLEVVDTFELALTHQESDPIKFREGVELIFKKFQEFLSKREVKAESAIGKEFDPMKHEAISRVPSKDKVPGTVLHELRKAYFYRDRLLRPGQVVVAVEGDIGSDSKEEKPEETGNILN